MMTDPISDMLTRIRNASSAGKEEVILPYSNIKYAIAVVLAHEGYLQSVNKVTEGKFPNLALKIRYEVDGPRIRGINRVSKPGHRVYAKNDGMPRVLSGFGVAIVSTPNGVMTAQEARRRHLGGEVICEVF